MSESASVVMPEATIEVIASLAEHRALSTAQVHAIHLPGRGLRRTQQLLADLGGSRETTSESLASSH